MKRTSLWEIRERRAGTRRLVVARWSLVVVVVVEESGAAGEGVEVGERDW